MKYTVDTVLSALRNKNTNFKIGDKLSFSLKSGEKVNAAFCL